MFNETRYKVGNSHYAGSHKHRRENIFHDFPQAYTDDAMRSKLPHQKPYNDKQCIEHHHAVDAPLIEKYDDAKLKNNLQNIATHIDIRPSIADSYILIHGVKRHESTTDAEHLKQRNGINPLFFNRE